MARKSAPRFEKVGRKRKLQHGGLSAKSPRPTGITSNLRTDTSVEAAPRADDNRVERRSPTAWPCRLMYRPTHREAHRRGTSRAFLPCEARQ